MQNTIRIRRPAQSWVTKHNKNTQTSATLDSKTQCNCDIQSSISWALKRPLQCAEQFLNLKICVSLHFRANDTPILARGFIHQNANAPRTTAPCIPKCENVRFATAPCAKMYESIGHRPIPFGNEKCKVLLQFWAIDTTFLPRGLRDGKWNLRFATVLSDRQHVLSERVAASKMKFAFRYSFGRSTPRFWREGCREQNEICVSLQFSAIDNTFLARGSRDGKMKFAFRYSFGRSTTRFQRKGWPRANEICVSLQFWAIDDAFLAKGLISGWPSPSRPAE